MLCLDITSEGYARLSEGDACKYVLLTVQEHSRLTDISNWFQFDISTVGIAFGSGLAIWVLGAGQDRERFLSRARGFDRPNRV